MRLTLPAALFTAAACTAEPIPVTVGLHPNHADRPALLRDGQPYFVKGVGGFDAMERLAELGANSVRTWGVGDETRSVLDAAEANGLTVMLGLWLPHPRHGYDYGDPEVIAKVLADVEAGVRQYKDHPALLAWGVGNEVDNGEEDPAVVDAVFATIEEAARRIKAIDPNHPTVAITADLGPDARSIRQIHDRCPSIDLIGLNTYGGAVNIADRYRDAGGTRPYLVTEYGWIGPWESGYTSWGTPYEPSSSEKARILRNNHTAVITDQPDLCLGGYAFLWGWKQEETSTWFGLRVADADGAGDRKTEMVDTLAELWTGRPPSDRAPRVEAFGLREGGEARFAPGTVITAEVTMVDPEGEPLAYTWDLRDAKLVRGFGGDREDTLTRYPDRIIDASVRGHRAAAEIRLPETPGAYRIFVRGDDPAGSTATANIPVQVID